jgi:long-chain acyl-CoA synthetase
MRLLVDQQRADEPGSLPEMLGGRVRFCCSGGAALPDHVARFYNERGVTLVQGYGLTETSPVVTLSTPEMNKVGCVGRTVEGVEVRIAADGEILTRGPHVMLGYWRKPEATAAVLRDGWFYTGDVGEIDADGFLRITGRKKELIVTAAGKNIAPVQLESLLGEDPLVHQAMVIGDGRNYLVALIVPGPDALKFEIMTRGIPVTNAAEALAHPAVRQLYTERIAQRLAGVSHYEQVQKFALLDRPFTIESGELTPTLKLRREVIAAHFADEIRRMYD